MEQVDKRIIAYAERLKGKAYAKRLQLGSKLDLEAMSKKVDELLANTTKEDFEEWLIKDRLRSLNTGA